MLNSYSGREGRIGLDVKGWVCDLACDSKAKKGFKGVNKFAKLAGGASACVELGVTAVVTSVPLYVIVVWVVLAPADCIVCILV